ncbi:transcriptional regulator NrdR [Anaerosporobacter faecicola]|uniref:transcriptional regulator NrdR n=1 Tax=Anaerosporobacter faecicola TaxID=2718714 RepID=UPI00143B1EDE|nr:transcriptional regulator NrdR [Anaerosporobacter faecicola]
MKCPFCGEENTRVIDSRPADDNSSIRRRRQCDQCKKRFTTYEKIEVIPLVVIKKDLNREPYNRSKIEAGVFRSCHKRPISVDNITAVVDDIENTIFNLDKNEINSSLIGEIVMDKLKELDPVAYVRFASIYREFKDVNTFMDELKKILDNKEE